MSARAWQRMLSGRRLDLLDPSALDVELSDIAHGLARVARWNGQTQGDHAYSVAQHSLLVEQILEKLIAKPTPEERLYALLHDAPEYVIGDMISPFKAVIGDAYRDVEARLQCAIHQRVGLAPEPPAKLKKLIKKADISSAYFEATELAGFSIEETALYFHRPRGLNPEDFSLTPLPTLQVQDLYLKRLNFVDAMRTPSQ